MQIDGWGTRAVEDAYTRCAGVVRAAAARRDDSHAPALFLAVESLDLLRRARAARDGTDVLSTALFALARESADEGMLLQAHHAQWSTLFMSRRSCGALRCTRVRRHRPLSAPEPGGRMFAFGSPRSGHLRAGVSRDERWRSVGRTDVAARLCEDAVLLARELDHPFTLAFTLVHAAAVHQARRDASARANMPRRRTQIAGDQSFGLIARLGSSFLGWSLARARRARSRLVPARDRRRAARATGSRRISDRICSLCSQARRPGLGSHADAQRSLEEAIAISDRTGEHFSHRGAVPPARRASPRHARRPGRIPRRSRRARLADGPVDCESAGCAAARAPGGVQPRPPVVPTVGVRRPNTCDAPRAARSRKAPACPTLSKPQPSCRRSQTARPAQSEPLRGGMSGRAHAP